MQKVPPTPLGYSTWPSHLVQGVNENVYDGNHQDDDDFMRAAVARAAGRRDIFTAGHHHSGDDKCDHLAGLPLLPTVQLGSEPGQYTVNVTGSFECALHACDACIRFPQHNHSTPGISHSCQSCGLSYIFQRACTTPNFESARSHIKTPSVC